MSRLQKIGLFVIMLCLIFGVATKRLNHGTIYRLIGTRAPQEIRLLMEYQRFIQEMLMLCVYAEDKGDLSLLPEGNSAKDWLTPTMFDAIQKHNHFAERKIAVESIYSRCPHVISGKDSWGNPIKISLGCKTEFIIYYRNGTKKKTTVRPVITRHQHKLISSVVAHKKYNIEISSASINCRDEGGKGDDIVSSRSFDIHFKIFPPQWEQ